MTKIRGKKVLVTGGANGIGRLLGERCLKEGAAHLVIWDIKEQRLAETKKEEHPTARSPPSIQITRYFGGSLHRSQ